MIAILRILIVKLADYQAELTPFQRVTHRSCGSSQNGDHLSRNWKLLKELSGLKLWRQQFSTFHSEFLKQFKRFGHLKWRERSNLQVPPCLGKQPLAFGFSKRKSQRFLGAV